MIYRGGSPEHGIANAYTREYVFAQAFRFYGVRTSQISLTIPGGGVDADPELALTLDLEAGRVSFGAAGDGIDATMPEGPRGQLLSGRWDSTTELLEGAKQLAEVEAALPYGFSEAG